MNIQKILVVDDDQRLLDSIKEILRSCQYHVTVASDGDKALNILNSRDFHIVITDNRMPKVSGIQLLNHIKFKHPGTKVIMMTGYPNEKTFYDSLDLGAFDCLVKPFRVSELLSAIVNCQQVKELPIEKRQLSSLILGEQAEMIFPERAINHFLGIISKMPFEDQVPQGAAIFHISDKNELTIMNHFGLDINVAGIICEEIQSNEPKSNPGWYEFLYLSKAVATVGKDFQSTLCAPLIQNDNEMMHLALFFKTRFIKQSYYYNKILSIFAERFIDLHHRKDEPIPIAEHQLNIITALVQALDEKNRFISGHSENVKQYSLQIASHLGLSDSEVKQIGLAGLLHDIGKIAVPNRILLKKGKLDEKETSIMKKHPENGIQWLNHIPELKDCLPIILYHHEWFNGSGYPHGLKDSQIPIGARILAVSDAFDAITSNRAYRLKSDPDIAYKELLAYSSTQFDTNIVDAFMEWVQTSDPLMILNTGAQADVSSQAVCG